MFVSVTRIDVVENYLQQETHSGEGGGLGDKEGREGEEKETVGDKGRMKGKGGESGESGGR